jgi:hypothetical protein
MEENRQIIGKQRAAVRSHYPKSNTEPVCSSTVEPSEINMLELILATGLSLTETDDRKITAALALVSNKLGWGIPAKVQRFLETEAAEEEEPEPAPAEEKQSPMAVQEKPDTTTTLTLEDHMKHVLFDKRPERAESTRRKCRVIAYRNDLPHDKPLVEVFEAIVPPASWTRKPKYKVTAVRLEAYCGASCGTRKEHKPVYTMSLKNGEILEYCDLGQTTNHGAKCLPKSVTALL